MNGYPSKSLEIILTVVCPWRINLRSSKNVKMLWKCNPKLNFAGQVTHAQTQARFILSRPISFPVPSIWWCEPVRTITSLRIGFFLLFRFLWNETVLFSFQERTIYIVEVMSIQFKVRNCQWKYITAAKFTPKFGPSQQNGAFATFQLLPCRKMGSYDWNSDF